MGQGESRVAGIDNRSGEDASGTFSIELSPALGQYISGKPPPPTQQDLQQQQQNQQSNDQQQQQHEQQTNWQYHQQKENLPPRITGEENARRAAGRDLDMNARKRLQEQFLQAYLEELKAQGVDLFPPSSEAEAGPCENMRAAALECLKTAKREEVGTACSGLLNGFRLCLQQKDE